jgi:hypothetical protein
VELEDLKIKTRLTNEKFASVEGECDDRRSSQKSKNKTKKRWRKEKLKINLPKEGTHI